MTNVLVFISNFIPSNIISILKPLKKLENDGVISLRVRPEKNILHLQKDVNWCHVAFFSRSQSTLSLRAMIKLKAANKKIIYDIDDNFFEIPLNTILGQHHRYITHLFVQKLFYQYSDLVHLYNPILNSQVIEHSGTPKFMKSYFDKSLLNTKNHIQKTSSNVIKIAYATGRIDDPRLEKIVFSAIKIIAETYKKNVEFHFWGAHKHPYLKKLSNIILNKPILEYDRFIQSFQNHHFSIGLAPVLDEVFFQSKTNNKYREYGGCSIAGIYSDLQPYRECVRHQYNGILVENTIADWVNGMKTLIDSENLRKTISINACKDIFENYSFEKFTKEIEESINTIKEQTSCSLLHTTEKQVSVTIFNLEDNVNFVADYIHILKELAPNISPQHFYNLHVEEKIYFLQNQPDYLLIMLANFSYSATIIDLCLNLSKDTIIIIDLGDLTHIKKEQLRKLDEILNKISIKYILCNESIFPEVKDLSETTLVNFFQGKSHSIDNLYSIKGRTAALLSIIIEKEPLCLFPKTTNSIFLFFKKSYLLHMNMIWNNQINRLKQVYKFITWRLGGRKL